MKITARKLRKIIREELSRLNEDSAKTVAGESVKVNPSSTDSPPETDGVSFVLADDGDISNLLNGSIQVFKGLDYLKGRAFGVRALGSRPSIEGLLPKDEESDNPQIPYGAKLNLLYNPLGNEKSMPGPEKLVFQPDDILFTGKGGEDIDHVLEKPLRFEMIELDPESIGWNRS